MFSFLKPNHELRYDGIYHHNQIQKNKLGAFEKYHHLIVFTKPNDWLTASILIRPGEIDPTLESDLLLIKLYYSIIQSNYEKPDLDKFKLEITSSHIVEKRADNRYYFEIITGYRGVLLYDLTVKKDKLSVSLMNKSFTGATENIFLEKSFDFYSV